MLDERWTERKMESCILKRKLEEREKTYSYPTIPPSNTFYTCEFACKKKIPDALSTYCLDMNTPSGV